MAFGAEVCFTGRLITEPLESFSGEGRARCSFSILVGRTWMNRKTGQEESTEADFVVVTWGTLAENCKTSLCMGDVVVVTGRLEQVVFTDEHREQHVREELLANDVGPGTWNQTVHVTRNPRKDQEGQPASANRTQASGNRTTRTTTNRPTAAHDRATAGQRRAMHEDEEPF